MDWRTWMYDKVRGNATVSAQAGTRVFSVLGEKTPADKPFIVIRLDPDTPDIPGAAVQDAVVWVHDNPGTYVRIDTLLKAIRSAVEGPVAVEGAIYARWQGDSQDLADDARGTILRTSSYRLAERR